jgi:hypothetical protein
VLERPRARDRPTAVGRVGTAPAHQPPSLSPRTGRPDVPVASEARPVGHLREVVRGDPAKTLLVPGFDRHRERQTLVRGTVREQPGTDDRGNDGGGDTSQPAAERPKALKRTATPLDPVAASNLATILRVRYKATGDEADASAALHLLREATAPDHDGDRNPTALANLGRTHYARWVARSGMLDLDAAVTALDDAARVVHPRHGNASYILVHLGDVLNDRYLVAGRPDDATRAEEAYARAAALVGAGPVLRMVASANAAAIAATRDDWAVATDRYQSAIADLVAAVSHRAARRDREYQLTNHRTLASDAAAAALTSNRTPQAVAMPEAARGVLMGQLLDLRTDLDALYASHPDLAGRLDSVRRELASLTGDDLTP